MARRHIHYEAAFEDYLRSRGTAYLPVNENRKAIFAGARVKSFDFLIYRNPGKTWLVDVKGRKFPYTLASGNRYWENWVGDEDIRGLTQWQREFGQGFKSVFVFAYHLLSAPEHYPTRHIHPFRDQYYAFLAITVDDYAAHARQRSPRWETVSIPTKDFRRLSEPVYTD